MNLHQKRYPFGSVTFSISDTVVRVQEKRLLSSKSFEVPLRDFGTSVSTVRQFPLGWCIAASFSSLVAVACIVALFAGYGEPLGMGACLLMSGVFTALAWHGFLERKIDLVVLHARDAGHGVLFLHRTKPSVRHVEEFVEIAKERIEASHS